MGAILDQTIARAVSKNWIPAQDVEPIKARITQLGSKYGFSVDDFAIATHMESYGMRPDAGCTTGGCFGIIQFCSGTGLSTIGESKSSICSMSILQQLEAVDKFFGAFPKTKNAKSLDLADLYIAVLYPDYVGTKDMDARIPAGTQAADLHVGGSTSNPITKNSMIAGLKKRAAENLGGLGASDAALAKTGGTIPGDYKPTTSSVGGVVTGVISAVFKSSCTEPFPKEFTITEAIRYVGCKTKLASAQMGSSGLAYPAPGMQVPGSSATGLGQQVAGAPVCPGCLIWPLDTKFKITSPRQPNRNGRPHHGVDIGCPVGTPLLAAGDGEVIHSDCTSDPRGYGCYITIDHKNGLFTRYGHLREQGLPKGTQVKQGQLIGYSGNTGGSTGPHLHFEVRKANDFGLYSSTLDPLVYCKKG